MGDALAVGAVRRHIGEPFRVAPDDVPKTVACAVICHDELLRRALGAMI
jgi:hypothetical protein